MNRTTPLLVAAVLVASVLAVVPAAAVASVDHAQHVQSSQVDANASVAPGAQFAGAVGVQGAELDGEVDSRAYGLRVARANTDDARAEVVAGQVGDVERRLAALEQRKAALQQARENGSMSEGAYRARMAELHAETQTAQRLANQSSATARSLPAATLEANGVDVTAIETLRQQARELTGPEIAEIARGIAGPDAGKPVSPPSDRAPGAAGDRGQDVSGDRGPAGATDGTETVTDDPDAGMNTGSHARSNGNATAANETAPRADGN